MCLRDELVAELVEKIDTLRANTAVFKDADRQIRRLQHELDRARAMVPSDTVESVTFVRWRALDNVAPLDPSDQSPFDAIDKWFDKLFVAELKKLGR